MPGSMECLVLLFVTIALIYPYSMPTMKGQIRPHQALRYCFTRDWSCTDANDGIREIAIYWTGHQCLVGEKSLPSIIGRVLRFLDKDRI